MKSLLIIFYTLCALFFVSKSKFCQPTRCLQVRAPAVPRQRVVRRARGGDDGHVPRRRHRHRRLRLHRAARRRWLHPVRWEG